MIMKTQKFNIFLAVIVMLIGISMSAIASEKSAKTFVDSLGSKVITIITDAKLSDDNKEIKLSKMFRDSVDFEWIGNFVLGKHKRKASDEQKTQYIKAYKNFIVASYTKRFKDYSGEVFEIKSTRTEGKNKYLITTEIVRSGEANVLVNYKVKQVGADYKVYDIIVEGISLITTQRSEFNAVITRKGLDYLITQLKKKSSA